MQATAAWYAKEFNKCRPPCKVRYLEASSYAYQDERWVELAPAPDHIYGLHVGKESKVACQVPRQVAKKKGNKKYKGRCSQVLTYQTLMITRPGMSEILQMTPIQ